MSDGRRWRTVVEEKDTRRDGSPRGSYRKWIAVLDPQFYLAKLPMSRAADAHLMASAPELLALLKELRDTTRVADAMEADLYNAVCDAIGKAEGKP